MIVIAPDKFKGTYSAKEICGIIARHIRATDRNADIMMMPMADGGEGTAATISSRLNLPLKTIKATDPLGNPSDISFFSDGRTAAIDSSTILGRSAMPAPSPWTASSFPLGALIANLAREEVNNFYVGVGGTMTTDGGAGFLQATGFRFIDRNNSIIRSPISPSLLPSIQKILPPDSSSGILPGEISIKALIDVNVPLLPSLSRGEQPGAVNQPDEGLSVLSFAPQKGVAQSDMPRLVHALRNFADCLESMNPAIDFSTYGGAGGGLSLALKIIGAECLPGARQLWDDWIHTRHIRPDDITHIITGEGCFDSQSFGGKVTGTIIDFAKQHNIPSTVVCGRCELSREQIPHGTDVILLSSIQ